MYSRRKISNIKVVENLGLNFYSRAKKLHYFNELAHVNLPAIGGKCLGNGGSSLCFLKSFSVRSTSLSQYLTTKLYFSSSLVRGIFSLTYMCKKEVMLLRKFRTSLSSRTGNDYFYIVGILTAYTFSKRVRNRIPCGVSHTSA